MGHLYCSWVKESDLKVIAPGELLSLQSRKPSVYGQVGTVLVPKQLGPEQLGPTVPPKKRDKWAPTPN